MTEETYEIRGETTGRVYRIPASVPRDRAEQRVREWEAGAPLPRGMVVGRQPSPASAPPPAPTSQGTQRTAPPSQAGVAKPAPELPANTHSNRGGAPQPKPQQQQRGLVEQAMDMLGAFGAGGARGLTAGANDELAGAATGYMRAGGNLPMLAGRLATDPAGALLDMVTGYRQGERAVLDANAQARERHPNTFMAGEIAGGVAGALALPAGSGARGVTSGWQAASAPAKQAAPRVMERVASATAQGTGYGFAAGIAGADGQSAGERFGDGAEGAAMGALFAAPLAAAGEGVAALARRGTDDAGRVAERAADWLDQTAARGGTSVEAVNHGIAQEITVAGRPRAWSTVADELYMDRFPANMDNYARYLARRDGPGPAIAREAVARRRERLPGMFREGLSRALTGGSKNASERLARIVDDFDAFVLQNEQAAKPLYDRAFNAGLVLNQADRAELAGLLQRPEVARAVREARIRLANEGVSPVDLGLDVDMQTGAARVVGDFNPQFELRIYDRAKQVMDDTIEALIEQPRERRSEVSTLTATVNQLRGLLDRGNARAVGAAPEASPYALARAQWEGPAKAREAFRLGERALEMRPDAFLRRVRELPDAQREYVRAGYVNAIEGVLLSDNPRRALRHLRSEGRRGAIEALFRGDGQRGSPAFGRFVDYVDGLARMMERGDAIAPLGGSPTQPLQAAARSFEFEDEAAGVMGALTNPQRALERMLDGRSKAARLRQSEQMQDLLTDVLFAPAIASRGGPGAPEAVRRLQQARDAMHQRRTAQSAANDYAGRFAGMMAGQLATDEDDPR